MSFAAALFTPLVFLLPVASAVEVQRDMVASPAAASVEQVESAFQVRIEQRMSIRITPHPSPVRPNALVELPGREIGPQFVERKMSKCLPVSSIAGVQAGGGSRLILFLRNQNMVSAELERACQARDFYSGFYLARNEDGRLCVDRDTLLSRSGANCKLTRMRQLVEADE
jgi:hypothetical protein